MTAQEIGADERLSGRDATDRTGRLATQRDHDRVLYSESFRRLGAVTQVAIGAPETLLHNRLTHSLKVEQVGRSIFRFLESEGLMPAGADEWAISTACLAHDLGHPPFGHAGEEELHALVTCDKHRANPRPLEDRKKTRCRECDLEDGFEGNAQSFRILTALAETGHTEADDDLPRGLDLTVLSLRAATKYPWLRGDNPEKSEKWGAYDIDAEAFGVVTRGSQKLSFEAESMDWADDIAYAVHDIEDFHRTGHIPLDQYMATGLIEKENGEPEFEPREAFIEFLRYVEHHRGPVSEEAQAELLATTVQFPATRFTGTTRDFKALANMRGYLLELFIGRTTVEGDALKRDDIANEVNKALKQLIWYHVIDEPRLTNIQTGQRRVLREIFNEFKETTEQVALDWKRGAPPSRDMRRLPYALQKYLTIALRQGGTYDRKQRAYRALLDFISGMSEPEAYRTHAVLKGLEPDGRLDSK
ncbi:dNTP triphosphohydrolase [Microbacterium sp. cx-55]|uniref:deoxyguanosinetriphosphate triphosphohydrolase family protein n=1 Tax=Microbacterium sp. cx-55 TaxID=2875948 RepID=UPI001CC1B34E|nr:dNTP triphosphohydrolase [Microbacterium sp. cx-55]MBZ4488079.1 dNTP triphosphohydrolase [Microbacterium sp. cx-55]UGB34515.1 dNTP triphosphohydrolase [Microbacterium sp. cx-55]